MGEIVIKPGDIQAFLLAFAALLTAAGVIGSYVTRLWQRIRKPETKQDEKIAEHEQKLLEHETRINSIQIEIDAARKRQEETNKSEKAMQRVLLALVDYEMDNKSEAAKKNLEEARNKLRDYLVDK